MDRRFKWAVTATLWGEKSARGFSVADAQHVRHKQLEVEVFIEEQIHPAKVSTDLHLTISCRGPMSEIESSPTTPLVPLPVQATKPPPHPLDAKWHIFQNNAVYGPYTGHELKQFATDGIVDGATSVVRDGSEDWKKAGEDVVLARIFQPSHVPPPPSNVTAAKGATVVQVTNNLGPTLAAGMADDGDFGPKSAGLALLFSFLIVGGGQLYNGQIAKGILMFIGCVLMWLVLLGWIINIWSWIDAYQTAKKMNHRYYRRLAAGLPI